VLIIVLCTNAYAFYLSLKRLNQGGKEEAKRWRRIVASPMIETKTTFIVDLLGTSAAVVGLAAIGTYLLTGNAKFDGLGGMIIGAGMMIGSLLLIYDVKGLIVGRSLTDRQAKALIRRVRAMKGVNNVLDIRSMYIGSTKLLIVIEVHLDDALSTDAIEVLSDKIKLKAKQAVPHAAVVQVEVETPDEELV
jgi:divalent metal cation (Fe/Co/Zn/Cd) transporter